MKRLSLLVLFMLLGFLLVFAGSGLALDLAGVQVPETAVVRQGGPALVLNGAGIRKKLFIKVYVGALYLQAKTTDPAAAMSASGQKRIFMQFVYSEVEAEKLREAWIDGFRNNLPAEKLAAMKPRIDKFCAMFPSAKKGDVFLIDFVQGEGVTVTINGVKKGSIEGDDFISATLGIWLGGVPADSGLKAGMLGG